MLHLGCTLCIVSVHEISRYAFDSKKILITFVVRIKSSKRKLQHLLKSDIRRDFLIATCDI